MWKNFFLLIIPVIILTIIIYMFSGRDYKEAISVKNLKNFLEQNQEEEVKVIGNISEISLDSFSLVDIEFPEYETDFQFEETELSLRNFAIGDTVLITILSSEKKVLEIQKVNYDDAIKHLQKNTPRIEINIIEYTQEIKDPCENITFNLNIKNIGNTTIYYDDLYDEMYGYYLVYTINDESFNFYNIDDFESLNPGQDKDILVTSQEGLNSKMELGENLITFRWTQKSQYKQDYLSLFESESMSILLKNDKCN